MKKSRPSPSRWRFDAGDYFGMFLIVAYLAAFGASVAGIFDRWLPVFGKRTQVAVAPKVKAPVPPPGALVGAGAGPRRPGPRNGNRPVVPKIALQRRFKANGDANLHGLRFTVDGDFLGWIRSDGERWTFIRWDRTRKLIASELDLQLPALIASPTGELVVLEDRKKSSLIVFDTARNMEIGRIGRLAAPVSCDLLPVFSGKGGILVIAVKEPGKEASSLIVYDVEKRKEMARRVCDVAVTSVAVNSAGNQIVFATVKNGRAEVHSWLWRENEEKAVQAEGLSPGIRLIDFTRDSGFLAVPTGGAEVLLVEAFSAKVARRLTAPGIAAPRFQFAAFFPDGKYLLAACTSNEGAKLVVWSMADGKTVATADVPGQAIRELQLAPDAGHAATIDSERREIVLWDLFAQVNEGRK